MESGAINAYHHDISQSIDGIDEEWQPIVRIGWSRKDKQRLVSQLSLGGPVSPDLPVELPGLKTLWEIFIAFVVVPVSLWWHGRENCATTAATGLQAAAAGEAADLDSIEEALHHAITVAYDHRNLDTLRDCGAADAIARLLSSRDIAADPILARLCVQFVEILGQNTIAASMMHDRNVV